MTNKKIKYIIENIDTLPKQELINIGKLLYNNNETKKYLKEKSDNLIIKFKYLPNNIINDIYEIIYNYNKKYGYQ